MHKNENRLLIQALSSNTTDIQTILGLCDKVDPEFVAKIAIYSREKRNMKEVPTLLTCWLAAKNHNILFTKVFNKVIDNGKMLSNFVRHMRNNVTGRKCLGTLPKRNITNWFNSRTDDEIFSQSIGNDPSFKKIIKLSHPKPLNRARNALYRYLTGKNFVFDELPKVVKSFKRGVLDQNEAEVGIGDNIFLKDELNPDYWVSIIERVEI